MALGILGGLLGMFGGSGFPLLGVGGAGIGSAMSQAMSTGIAATEEGLHTQSELNDLSRSLMPITADAAKYQSAASAKAAVYSLQMGGQINLLKAYYKVANNWVGALGS